MAKTRKPYRSVTDEQIATALTEALGVISEAARRLDVSRCTVDKRVRATPALKQICTDMLEAQLDAAEQKLQAMSQDTEHKDAFNATKFFLERRGAARGWSPKSAIEVTGKNGGPIEVRDRMKDLRKLTPRELASLAASQLSDDDEGDS